MFMSPTIGNIPKPLFLSVSLGVFCVLIDMQASSAHASVSPHILSVETDEIQQCLNCHRTKPAADNFVSGKHVLPQENSYTVDFTSMCTKCHGDESASHIVGVTPEYSVPADLPLDANGQMTCLTCHYMHGTLTSEKPMASMSIIDRLLHRERLKKSYVLRRNNADGDLCIACHNQ